MEQKKLIGIFIIVPLLIALIFVGLTRKCRRSGNHPKLEILRESPDSAARDEGSKAVPENGMIKEVFRVSPTTFQVHDESAGAGDPFAEPVQPSSFKYEDPKKMLENVGVTFDKGSSATYDPVSNELTAINTREQLELIDAFLGDSVYFQEKQIAIRAEIYEMPALTALEAIESAAVAINGDHSPERNAIRKLLGRGRVKLVNATTIIARSGQRAKVEDTMDFPLPLSKTSSNKKEDENGDKPDWEIRKVGTTFEVDPVLGADNYTIDLNFSIQHHTASPNPKSGKGIPPVLHAKQITTQVTLLDGFAVLIGSWKPTGKPEYEKNDLTQLVFVTANVHFIIPNTWSAQ